MAVVSVPPTAAAGSLRDPRPTAATSDHCTTAGTQGAHSATVGVVVAAWNAQAWIAESLESLRTQDFRDWVCVVVDDGSTDGTAAVIADYVARDGRFVLLSQANTGLPTARNNGIAALPDSCEYVAFLDSDDLYEPDTLASLVAVLRSRPDAVGAYGLAEYIDEQSAVLRPGLHPGRQQDRRAIGRWLLRDVPVSDDATFETLVVAGPIWPPAVAVQRLSAVRAVGGFDPTFTSQEDWDLYVRLTRHGPYATLNRTLAGYRRHGGNLTNSHFTSVYQQERVRHKAFSSPANTPEQRRQVGRAWRYLQTRHAAVLAKQALVTTRNRRWSEVGPVALGSLVAAATALRSGPPEASMRRLRLTQPADLASNILIPAEDS